MTLRKKAEELGGLIKTFKGLRLITQAASVASGFCFFYYSMSQFIKGFVGAGVVAAILGIAILIAIECAVQYTLTKCTKMVCIKDYSLATGLGVLAVMFFGISFYISTNGIYLAMSDTTDKVVNVAEGYDDAKAMVAAEYDSRIAEMKKDLAAIKAPSWNKGNLTTPQQELMAKTRAEINKLYDEKADALSRLKDEHSAELESISEGAEKQASDYYMYVVVLMSMELMTNVLITFWFYQIKKQEDPNLAIHDEYSTLLERQTETIKRSFWNDSQLVQAQLAAQLGNMFSQRTAYTAPLPYQVAALQQYSTTANGVSGIPSGNAEPAKETGAPIFKDNNEDIARPSTATRNTSPIGFSVSTESETEPDGEIPLSDKDADGMPVRVTTDKSADSTEEEDEHIHDYRITAEDHSPDVDYTDIKADTTDKSGIRGGGRYKDLNDHLIHEADGSVARCLHCGKPLSASLRIDCKYCSTEHRMANHGFSLKS